MVSRSNLKQAQNRLHNLYGETILRLYMTNKNNSVLYTGITNDLKRRAFEHKEKLIDGFTKKYNITKLVYNVEVAILREKQVKAGSRAKKIELINSINGEWKDLCYDL